ncbi:MAG: NADH-quinone oxidoreductase subunit J [Methanosarcinales archaeon]|nr:NADH-quinone oxidoreductase subunit J [Methanosarcinales archaeon]
MAIATSIMVIVSKDIVHSALYLIGFMISIAALYITLNAQFIGVVQVLVYVGGIGILILFAVMLTSRAAGGEQ